MYPQLYSMIAPNLFQGGTDDLDVIHLAQTNNRPRTDLPFDAIVTMYAWARPADWKVQEFRYGVPDASITDIDLDRLRQAVDFGYDRWKQGDRVLVRCQAGLNRSGLVLALILIKDGLTPTQAIARIRDNRGEDALFNRDFHNWLLTEGESFFSPSSQQAA
ncbi:MAG: dual specificity protein phosphatase family protein [Actinobacteria bacterium]|nr:dual specificity protein phosphatase family protein [Actinomycetota bacterium]